MYKIEENAATNQFLSSKICNKNIATHHCKSDFVH